MLTDPKLRSQVDALWDKFWTGGLTNPLDAIEQFSYLMFLKQMKAEDASLVVPGQSPGGDCNTCTKGTARQDFAGQFFINSVNHEFDVIARRRTSADIVLVG